MNYKENMIIKTIYRIINPVINLFSTKREIKKYNLSNKINNCKNINIIIPPEMLKELSIDEIEENIINKM